MFVQVSLKYKHMDKVIPARLHGMSAEAFNKAWSTYVGNKRFLKDYKFTTYATYFMKEEIEKALAV